MLNIFKKNLNNKEINTTIHINSKALSSGGTSQEYEAVAKNTTILSANTTDERCPKNIRSENAQGASETAYHQKNAWQTPKNRKQTASKGKCGKELKKQSASEYAWVYIKLKGDV